MAAIPNAMAVPWVDAIQIALLVVIIVMLARR